MRRWGSDEWAALVMLGVVLAIAIPVFTGLIPTDIPRVLWSLLYLAAIAGLLMAAGFVTDRRARLSGLFASSALSWYLIATVQQVALSPVILVVIAAVSTYVFPLWASFVLVGVNSLVLFAILLVRGTETVELLAYLGFYLLIQLASMLSSAALLREQRLRSELETAHIELRTASALIRESAGTAERLRISRELHDVIGHQLTVLTLELEAAKHRDATTAAEHIARADCVARALLGDVRKVVDEVRHEPGDLESLLGEITADLPGLRIDVEVDERTRPGERETAALARAAQEIVTNTVRHASAKELWFSVRADGSHLLMEAGDDGTGAKEILPGNGLHGMVERVEDLGGEVEMSGSDGFRTRIRIPLNDARERAGGHDSADQAGGRDSADRAEGPAGAGEPARAEGGEPL